MKSEIVDSSLFGGRMCLPERDVRRGWHVQVILLCLVGGLRDVVGGFAAKRIRR